MRLLLRRVTEERGRVVILGVRMGGRVQDMGGGFVVYFGATVRGAGAVGGGLEVWRDWDLVVRRMVGGFLSWSWVVDRSLEETISEEKSACDVS